MDLLDAQFLRLPPGEWNKWKWSGCYCQVNEQLSPLSGSSHVIPHRRRETRFLPTSFHLQKAVWFEFSSCCAELAMRRRGWESCLWLRSVTYTIIRLHPVIKAALLFLGHFLLPSPPRSSPPPAPSTVIHIPNLLSTPIPEIFRVKSCNLHSSKQT